MEYSVTEHTPLAIFGVGCSFIFACSLLSFGMEWIAALILMAGCVTAVVAFLQHHRFG